MVSMVDINNMEKTTLEVTRGVRDWLDDRGERGESFDQILRRLLKIK